ncbi:MAG TPA: hypothetical protein V6C71_26505 [Coleofasciculaceae cyanobacterium]
MRILNQPLTANAITAMNLLAIVEELWGLKLAKNKLKMVKAIAAKVIP